MEAVKGNVMPPLKPMSNKKGGGLGGGEKPRKNYKEKQLVYKRLTIERYY